MASGVLGEVVARAKAVATAVAEFSKEMAFELKLESQEAVRTGFGVPRAITSVASFGCFAVAAAGTASMTLDFVKKVYGLRECDGCVGWDCLTCQACQGTGHTRGAPEAACPSCSGTGVVKCGVCKGNSWKPKFTMDRILDSPVAGWDAYRKCQPVTGDAHQEALLALVNLTVESLPVPPRPASWRQPSPAFVQTAKEEAEKAPLKWGQRREAVVEESVSKARVVQERMLDAAWVVDWREQQTQEIIAEMNQGLAKVRRQGEKRASSAARASGEQQAAATS